MAARVCVQQTDAVTRWSKTAALGIGGAWVVATLVVTPLAGVRAAEDLADPIVLVPVFWFAGAVAFYYRPDVRCARLLYLAGTLIAAAHALAALPAAVHAPSLWPVNLAAQVSFTGGFAAWAIALALFPDGTVESRSERLFTATVATAAVLLPTLGFFSAPRQELIGAVSQPATPVPVYSTALAPLHSAAEFMPAAVLVGAVLLALRYRRSEPRRQDQIRWPLFAAAAAATALVASSPITALLGSTAQAYVVVAIVAMLPTSLVLGMFRDGLFDVDRFVLRSLVFGALWIGIGAVFATVAELLGLAAGRQLALAPAVGIAIVAAMAFQPARTRLERVADRWVYGDRLSDHEAMRRLGAALESAGDVEDVAGVVAVTVKRGLRCEWALIRRAEHNGAEHNGAEHDGVLAYVGPSQRVRAVADLSAPIRHAGETLGWIECGGPRSVRGSDVALLEDFARQISPALHNTDLNKRLEERVVELSQSRARLVRAEEDERRRIERDLHDGVQAQLVAVAAKVDLARLQLASNPGAVGATLDALAVAVRNTHLELRELVRGIHPAALEDHGLVRAIEDRTAGLPLRVTVQANDSMRRCRLAADLEGAAYFFAIEAVTNVLRHAAVQDAVVTICRTASELHVEVTDHGRGFKPDSEPLRGLRGLADRLHAVGGRLDIVSAPGVGTRLLGVLPVDAVAGTTGG